MVRVFMETLPLALAAAISVTSILVFFTILVSKEKQIENGLAFIVGGFIAYGVVMLLVMFSLGKAAPASAPKHVEVHAAIDFVLAALCALIVVKSLIKKDDAGKKKEAKAPGGVFAFMGLGALMRVASANTLPPFISASQNISASRLPIETEIILGIIVILVSMLPMILPWLLFLFNKEKAVAVINPISVFLEKNKKKISNIVLIVIALYMVVHGLKHLGIM